jgi:hypothetical protein
LHSGIWGRSWELNKGLAYIITLGEEGKQQIVLKEALDDDVMCDGHTYIRTMEECTGPRRARALSSPSSQMRSDQPKPTTDWTYSLLFVFLV